MMRFQLSAELPTLFFFLSMLYYPAVEIPQTCSFLERIPVGKRQCIQSLTFIQAKEFVFFSNFVLYIPPPLHLCPLHFLLAVDNNKTSSVLHETSYFGSWPTWAVIAQFFGQIFVFLGFPCTYKVVLFKTH